MIELGDKIAKGVKLAGERLLEQKKKEDGVLILTDENGVVIHVRAREFCSIEK